MPVMRTTDASRSVCQNARHTGASPSDQREALVQDQSEYRSPSVRLDGGRNRSNSEAVCPVCLDTRCSGTDGVSPCQMVGVTSGEYEEAMEAQPDEGFAPGELEAWLDDPWSLDLDDDDDTAPLPGCELPAGPIQRQRLCALPRAVELRPVGQR